MPDDDYDQLMNELKAWARDAEHGERKDTAKALGVSSQLFSHWVTGRRRPNARNAFKLQAFLTKWKQAKNRGKTKGKTAEPS